MRKLRVVKWPNGGKRVYLALSAALLMAGLLVISPVLAGKLSKPLNDHISGLEAGSYVGFLGHHHPPAGNSRTDALRRARCATNVAYRAANPAGCPALTPAAARVFNARAIRCSRPAFRRAHPLACPGVTAAVSRRLKQIFELNPAVSGKWTGRIQVQSLAISAILLPTGKVLWYAYPYNPNKAPVQQTVAERAKYDYAEAYVWDPATGTSVRRDPPANPLTGKPYDIWCSGQAMLRDGRVVVAGGNKAFYISPSYPGSSGVEEKFKGLDVLLTFNPFTETWTKQPSMQHGRWYPTLAELPDGRVVIMGGLNESGGIGNVGFGNGEINNPQIEVFTPSADIDGVGSVTVVGQRYTSLYPHLFSLPGGKLLIVGPDPTDTALYDTNTWAETDVANFPGGRREWGSATLLPGGPSGPTRLMLVGGSNTDGANGTGGYNDAPATDSTILLDIPAMLANPGSPAIWTAGPASKRKRSHLNTTILPDGTLLTTGGGIGSQDGSLFEVPKFTAEILSPDASSWTETDPQGEERTYHSTSILLPDGRIASSGDDRDDHTTNLADRVVELYSPSYLYKGPRPTITSLAAAVPYNSPFGVGTPDAASVTRAVMMKLGATTHAMDSDQRSLQLTIAPAPGGITLTSPTDPTAATPGYYQVFLQNAAGAVSAGRMIRLDTGVPPPGPNPPSTAGLPSSGPVTPPVKRAAPTLRFLKPTVRFSGRTAIVSFKIRASKAFKGRASLAPRKGKGKKPAKTLVSRGIAGRGGRPVVVTMRFSTTKVKVPVKLTLTVAVRDSRGGAVRTSRKSLLIVRRPKPLARIGNLR